MSGDIIYLVVYLFTEFSNYLLAYSAIFQAKISKDKKRWILTVGIILAFHYTVLFLAGVEAATGTSAFTMLVIPLFLLKERKKKYFVIYPFVIMGTSVFAISFTFLVSMIVNIPEYKVIQNHFVAIMCQCIPTIVLLAFHFYRKSKGIKPVQLQLGISQYILFYVGVICTFFMLSSLQLISEGDLSVSNINFYGAAVSIACIVFVLLILWQGIVVYREVQMREQNHMYEQYMTMQEEHFRQIMQQDEKMRRFRHDINAHMAVLRSYCNSENNAELKSYIQNMIEQYKGNQRCQFMIYVPSYLI